MKRKNLGPKIFGLVAISTLIIFVASDFFFKDFTVVGFECDDAGIICENPDLRQQFESQSIVDTDLIYIEKDEEEIRYFLNPNGDLTAEDFLGTYPVEGDQGDLNVTEFLESISELFPVGSVQVKFVTTVGLIDANDNVIERSGSIFNIPKASLIDKEGNLLDFGGIQLLFDVTGKRNSQVIADATVEIFLDQKSRGKVKLSANGNLGDNGKIRLNVDPSVSNPMLSERQKALTFTFKDESANWVDGTLHRVDIVLYNIVIQTSDAQTTEVFSSYNALNTRCAIALISGKPTSVCGNTSISGNQVVINPDGIIYTIYRVELTRDDRFVTIHDEETGLNTAIPISDGVLTITAKKVGFIHYNCIQTARYRAHCGLVGTEGITPLIQILDENGNILDSIDSFFSKPRWSGCTKSGICSFAGLNLSQKIENIQRNQTYTIKVCESVPSKQTTDRSTCSSFQSFEIHTPLDSTPKYSLYAGYEKIKNPLPQTCTKRVPFGSFGTGKFVTHCWPSSTIFTPIHTSSFGYKFP